MYTMNQLVAWLKTMLYQTSGEPYRFGDHVLRFMVGTRPVRTKYRNSECDNTRYDALQVELIRDTLRPGDSAIDIGAHAGQYGILMSAACGKSGFVVCFEPDSDAVSQLNRNFALNPTLKAPVLVQAACSEQTGTARFFTQGGNSQSSLALTALPERPETKEVIVQTMNLDEWWFEHGKGEVKLVKIDTEGAEVHVLRGMKRLLSTNALVVCELHPYAWKEFGVCFQDLLEIAKSSDRTVKWLDTGASVTEPVKYGTVLLERIDKSTLN